VWRDRDVCIREFLFRIPGPMDCTPSGLPLSRLFGFSTVERIRRSRKVGKCRPKGQRYESNPGGSRLFGGLARHDDGRNHSPGRSPRRHNRVGDRDLVTLRAPSMADRVPRNLAAGKPALCAPGLSEREGAVAKRSTTSLLALRAALNCKCDAILFALAMLESGLLACSVKASTHFGCS